MCLINAEKITAQQNVTCYKIICTREEIKDDSYSEHCYFFTPYQYASVSKKVIQGKEHFKPTDKVSNFIPLKEGFTVNGGFIHSYANLEDAIADAKALTKQFVYGDLPNMCIFECSIDKNNTYMKGKVLLNYKDKLKGNLPDGYASFQIRFVKLVTVISNTKIKETFKT